jgi:hypothetical protein
VLLPGDEGTISITIHNRHHYNIASTPQICKPLVRSRPLFIICSVTILHESTLSEFLCVIEVFHILYCRCFRHPSAILPPSFRHLSATYATMCIPMIRMIREEVLRSLTLSTTIPPLIRHVMHAISPHSYREFLFHTLKMSCDYGS